MANNKFNLYEYLNEFSFAGSLSSELLNNSLTTNSINILSDYSDFKSHIFFGNATRKTTTTLNWLIDNYPIGINGQSTSSLNSSDIAKYDSWSLSADKFSKFVLDYICGKESELGLLNTSIDNIFYYYVDNNKVKIIYQSSSPLIITVNSNYEAIEVSNQMLALNYDKLITLTDYLTGINYRINVLNIQTLQRSSNTITIKFVNNQILDISFVDAAKAIHEFQYAEKVFENRDFLNRFTGTKVIVDKSGTADYTSISAASIASTSGQAIIVNPGSYYEDIELKNGLKYYFYNGATLYGEFYRSVSASYSADVIGYGTFIAAPEGISHIYQGYYDGSLTHSGLISKLYFEYNNIYTNGYRTFFIPHSEVHIITKGNKCKAYTLSSYSSFIDTDCGITCTIDAIEIQDADEISFIAYNNQSGRCSIKNVKFINVNNGSIINGSSNISLSSDPSFNYYYDLENVNFETNSTLLGSIYLDYEFGSDSTKRYNLSIYNSIFKSSSEYAFYSSRNYSNPPSFKKTITAYGKNYGAFNSNEYLEFSPTYNLTLSSSLENVSSFVELIYPVEDSNGKRNFITFLPRDTNNNVSNVNVLSKINTLLEAATLFDEGINKIKLTSGTGSDLFTIETFDNNLTVNVVPEIIRVSENRGASLEKYMTHQTPFFIEDDELEIFQRTVNVIADFFDSIKDYIDQFPNLFSFNYSNFNRSPEGRIQYFIAKQLGLELFESSIAGKLPQYYSNSDAGLQKITYQIWNRILNDINQLFKSKGTKNALIKLMRNFGFYDGFMSIREYVDNLETSLNYVEKNIHVKVPKFGTSACNFLDIKVNSISSVSAATILFSTYIPLIDSYEDINYEIANIFGHKFLYDAYNKKYFLNYDSLSADIFNDEDSVNLFTSSISNKLTPVIFSITGFYDIPLTASVKKIDIISENLYKQLSLTSSGSFSGLPITSNLKFGSSTGEYYFSNIKLFNSYIQPTKYLINPHIRNEENNLVFDYKLYDVPTTTALNSFFSAITGTINSSTATLSGGILVYDILPINLKRDFYTVGLMNPGGDFVLTSDSLKRGSNNIGYGLFSAESINNDILDFYSSNTAANITSIVLDPSVYYSDTNRREWTSLKSYKEDIFSRYDEGIRYDKFIRVAEKYKDLLSNFFNTSKQFIRFKSNVVQQGINIEQTLIERDKHRIDSNLDSRLPVTTQLTNYTLSTVTADIKSVSISSYSYTGYHIVSNKISFTAQSNTGYHYPGLNIASALTSTVTAYSNSSVNSSVSAIQSISSSTTSGQFVSVTGYQSLTGDKLSAIEQSLTSVLLNDISYYGIKSYDSEKYDEIVNNSITNFKINNVFTKNKDVIETANLNIPLTGYIDIVRFIDNNFLDVGKVTTINFNQTSNLIGKKIYSSFTGTPASSFSGGAANLYFITTFNGTTPVTGTLSAITCVGYITASNAYVVGLLQGDLMIDNFKHIGQNNETNFFRKTIRMKLKALIDNENYKTHSKIIDIQNAVDGNTNLPIFHFYCYNNNTYYRDKNFKLPIYKDGTELLLSVNSAFSNSNLGNQSISIFNKLNSSLENIDINVIRNSSDYEDSTFTKFNDNQITITADNLNTQVTVIDSTIISASSFTLGTYPINYSKGIQLFYNGVQQDEGSLWEFQSTNKINFLSVESMSANDKVTTFFYY